MAERYDLLLDQDDIGYQPPKYHTISGIKDLGKTFKEQIQNIDLFQWHTREQQVDLENGEFDTSMNRYLNVNKFIVEYITFPLQISKKQVRIKGQPNRMRLNHSDAKIQLHLIFDESIEFKDIFKIKMQVRRANTIPSYVKLYTGFVTLDEVETFQQEDGPNNMVIVNAHLDNLVEEDEAKGIYELAKNAPNQNEFILVIKVSFHDGSTSNFTTRSFSVVGQHGEKRKAPGSPDSQASSTKARIFERFCDPTENKNFANHQRIVYQIIEAKQGIFENLKANVIKTGKGDIAYHFVLKDQSSRKEYKPGEIIGFTTDRRGKVVIDKLSPSNANQTFLKGVVTESQYIEAYLPEDRNVITATICMLGIVPVRVMGPVLPGEGLFASEIVPGTAVSEKCVESPKTDSLIGHAFEGVNCQKDQTNDVQALVSIMSGAGQDLVVRQLSILEKSLKHSIRFNTIRSRKCFTLFAVLVVLCCILIGTIVYQVKAPGTMYQKWKCKQGSIGTCRYWYWLRGGEYLGYQFNGCRVAWKKAISERRFNKRPHSKDFDPICKNGTTSSGKEIKYNYYINLDSCSGVSVAGARYMFAVDEHCNSLYLFDEVDGKWRKDKKICFYQRCNIICNDKKRECPAHGWKNCQEVT